MKIFVLGSTGMLGNYISSYLKQQVERDTDQTYDVVSFSREHIDASDVEGYRFLRSLFKRNGMKEGDYVIAAECRPISKSVSFVVVEVRS